MTTMTEPRPTVPGRRSAEPDAPDAPELAHADTPQEQPEPEAAPTRRLTRIMWAVVGVAVVSGLAAAITGFALSYNTLVDAAAAWGFGTIESHMFPLGLDGLIIALYAFDLVLVWRQMPKPMLRIAAHGITAATIGLNIVAATDSAGGSLSVWQALVEQPGRLLSHAAMPVAYVLLTEAVRHLIARTARLEAGDTGLSLADWLLRPGVTWWVFRTAKTYPMPYAEARKMRREMQIHRVWIQYREEIETARREAAEAGRDFDEHATVTVLDRLPDLLAPYGVTPDEALALPDRMRAREQQRRAARERAEQELRHKAEAERREREHAETLARLAAEADQIRVKGEVDALRATVDGQRRAAEHRAAALADTAGIEASAARSAAERAATEEQRRAEAEAEAEESARTAALRRKAAEDDAAAARQEAETARRRAALAEEQRRTAQAEADEKRAKAAAAEDDARAARAEREAAAARQDAAALNLRAALAEEAAGLSDRERQERRVARMILAEAGGDHLRMPTTVIQERLGIANSTATGYRDAAARLIASGYDPAADPIHAMEVR